MTRAFAHRVVAVFTPRGDPTRADTATAGAEDSRPPRDALDAARKLNRRYARKTGNVSHMPFLESVFRTLERVDSSVTRVRKWVRREADAAPPTEVTAVKADRPRVDEPETPLGDPSVAVQVYGRGTDPWTGRATLLLKDRMIQFVSIDLDAKGNERLAPRLETETRQRVTPYVYIRGEFIGGFNALDEIERLGQLEERVKTAEERARSPNRGIKIEIATRGPEEAPPGEH